MKKKMSLIIILILSMLLFISCTGGSYTMTMGSLNGDSKHIEGKYNSFNGKYYSRIKLSKGDTIEYTSSYNTNSGEIDLVLLDKEKNVVADLQTTNSVDIVEDGYYYFTAIGDHHSGSFKVEWDRK